MERKYQFAEEFRDQVLRCSSCGFCRSVCPVFGLTKRPAYNARGKMLILKEVMDGTIPLNDELIETLKDLTVKFASGKKSVNFELIHFLKLWLTKHIQESDMAYTGYFLERGVVAKPSNSGKGENVDGFSIKKMWSKLWNEQ
jgi:ferredoxin